jgi:phosphomannomutase
MITGSHNPPEYNGIKILLGSDTIDGQALQALRERIENDAFCTGCGTHQPLRASDEYLLAISEQIKLKKPLRIVVDCGNGVPGMLAPALYRQLGCAVDALYCEVDGHFPNHHPDPQIPANLADLQKAVLASGADVGLAFDGDGDRLGVVSRNGRIIPGDQLLMLFAQAELADHPGLVLYDVKSSRLVASWVEALGGMTRAIPTGHSHMKRELAHSGALVAGELSGHFAFADWGVDDALYAGAKLLTMIANGMDLDAEIAAMPQSMISPELQIKVNDNAHELVDEIAERATFPSANRIFTVDGLRIEYPDGFGLIRASNTTPVLTLRIEADNATAQQRIKHELAAAIAPLPFPELE